MGKHYFLIFFPLVFRIQFPRGGEGLGPDENPSFDILAMAPAVIDEEQLEEVNGNDKEQSYYEEFDICTTMRQKHQSAWTLERVP